MLTEQSRSRNTGELKSTTSSTPYFREDEMPKEDEMYEEMHEVTLAKEKAQIQLSN